MTQTSDYTSESDSDYAGVGTAYLLSTSDELADDDAYTIHGVALGVGDLTIGQSGVKKLWPAEALREAADTLEGKPLVKNHNNTTDGSVGKVTTAEFRPGVGVVYEAEIATHYDELANDVDAGLMEVSVRAYHAPEEELEEDEETGALIVDEVFFDNLSLVNQGASPSNTAEPGPVSDMVGDMDSVEASAVVGGQMATAVLERSVAIDSVNNRPQNADDSTEDTQTEEASETESTDEVESDDDAVEDADVDADVVTDDTDSEEMADDGETSETDTDVDADVDVDVDALEWSVHDPQFEKTVSDGDVELELEDWGFDDEWDELDDVSQEIVSEHFLASESGFPPKSFDDLGLPVVTPDGELVEDALLDVQDDSPDLEDDVTADLEETVSELLDDEFAVEENGEGQSDSTVATVLTESGTLQTATLSTVSNSTNMNIEYEEITAEELGEDLDLDGKVVVEQDELESLSESAEKADTVENELSELSNRLDEQDDAREIVDELSEEEIDLVTADDETTVVECGKVEMVDEVTSIYAEELAEYSPWDAEELADTFGPMDLKEKIDEHEEAELSATIEDSEPEPDAGDVSSEELSESEEEAELEEKIEEYAEQLEDDGWERQAERVRSGDINPFGE